MTEKHQSSRHLTILTGGSRGMGLAMARQLLAPGHTLICISRHDNTALAGQAADAGCTLIQWCMDLSDGAAASITLHQWLAAQCADAFAFATLINNAGMIPAIAPITAISAADIAKALRVGLEAPMLLTSAFLNATSLWAASRKVLNISSGLGRRPMASQAPYCAAKAGMDHFTHCLALEESAKTNGAKVCSLAPGVIDTDMQLQLRSADSGSFADQKGFENLKAGGSLTSPEDAAKSILAYLVSANFGSEVVADIRK